MGEPTFASENLEPESARSEYRLSIQETYCPLQLSIHGQRFTTTWSNFLRYGPEKLFLNRNEVIAGFYIGESHDAVNTRKYRRAVQSSQ